MDVYNLMKKIMMLLILLMLVVIYDASASPFFPQENDVVFKVNKLKRSLFDNTLLNENDLTIKVRNLISQARETNNPLMFGKVEALLIKNRNVVKTSEKLKIYYADVLQQRHAFSDAIYKVDKINTSEANLLRATINLNLGEYKKASSECKKLIGKVDFMVASTCLLHAESYQGNLLHSLTALEKINKIFEINEKTSSIWTLTALADMSNRLGNNNASLKYYEKALEIKPNNTHVMSEMIDVLYEMQQQDKIVKVLEGNHADIRLNLRYFRSTNLHDGLSHKNLPELIKLKNEILLLEMRKDMRHYDTRAEYYIWIEKEPAKAIFWAQKNWEVSHTPTSAKLLIHALSSNKTLPLHKEMAKEVENWAKDNNVEDSSLIKMIKKMTAHEVMV